MSSMVPLVEVSAECLVCFFTTSSSLYAIIGNSGDVRRVTRGRALGEKSDLFFISVERAFRHGNSHAEVVISHVEIMRDAYERVSRQSIGLPLSESVSAFRVARYCPDPFVLQSHPSSRSFFHRFP